MEVTRKLTVKLLSNGRFLARVFWKTGNGWERVASASFGKFPVVLCERLNTDYGDGWELKLS